MDLFVCPFFCLTAGVYIFVYADAPGHNYFNTPQQFFWRSKQQRGAEGPELDSQHKGSQQRQVCASSNHKKKGHKEWA